MIVRIQASGGSFVGAGRYYLHDKSADKDLPNRLKPTTDERVWFTDTRNLFATDPERAFVEMWKTADDQAYLKVAAGVRTSGRSSNDPVKTLSLAWHKDEKPTAEQMVQAADAFLKHMGWDQHQAVYVGHRDTAHPHIHVIVNRVHPENGRTLDDYREQVRAQGWALAYEKEHGHIWCEQREVNAHHREERHAHERGDGSAARTKRQPANQHLPHNVIHMSRPLEQAYETAETSREALDIRERALLKEQQRAEREAWFKEGRGLFKATRHAVYDEVRAAHKDAWRQYYRDEKAAEKEAAALSGDALLRAWFFARDGHWQKAELALTDLSSVRDETEYRLYDQAAALKKEQSSKLREAQKEACDALMEARKAGYADLLQRQRDERAAMRAAHSHGDRADFLLRPPIPPVATNENNPSGPAVEPAKPEPSPLDQLREIVDAVSAHAADIAADKRSTRLTDPSPVVEGPPTPEPTKSPTDLAASSIGSVAGYVADQMAEFFAPTPPEVREARTKADAKREAEKPEPAPSPYAKVVDAALRAAEEQREQQRAYTYWRERDRGKDWDRDR